MTQGEIVSLNDKGFGFLQIADRKSNLFFHAKDLIGVKFDTLRPGDRLVFSRIENTDRGEAAKELELVEYTGDEGEAQA